MNYSHPNDGKIKYLHGRNTAVYSTKSLRRKSCIIRPGPVTIHHLTIQQQVALPPVLQVFSFY